MEGKGIVLGGAKVPDHSHHLSGLVTVSAQRGLP